MFDAAFTTVINMMILIKTMAIMKTIPATPKNELIIAIKTINGINTSRYNNIASPPKLTLAPIFSPQRDRKSLVDCFIALGAPASDSTIIGIVNKLANVHKAPSTRLTI